MNIAICDDQIFVLNSIKEMTRRIVGKDSVITAFDGGIELEKYIYKEVKGDIDLLIIDIELGKMNGIELARRIQKDFMKIKIIFITGYIRYSEEIFEANPSYFLLKPIAEEKMKKAITHVKNEIENSNKIMLPFKLKGGEIINIISSDIIYFESVGRIVILNTNNSKMEMYSKLGEIEKRLPDNFLRCHQSYIINMNAVTALNMNSFSMNNNTQIQISQAKYSAAKRRYLLFLARSVY